MRVRIEKDGFGAHAEKVYAGISMVVRKTAFDIERRAKSLAAVDTGNMQGLIAVTTIDESPDRVVATVESAAEYSIHQEFGTAYQPGTPFMTPAMNSQTAAFMAAMKAVLAP